MNLYLKLLFEQNYTRNTVPPAIVKVCESKSID